MIEKMLVGPSGSTGNKTGINSPFNFIDMANDKSVKFELL